MILKAFLGLIALVAVILLFAVTRSDTLSVARSITINAPAERIFPFINDFHNWPLWAPQDKGDGSMTRSFSGSPSGIGAVSGWTSKGSAGTGSMTISRAESPRFVSVQVDWTRPFRLQNQIEFILEPAPHNATTVTWMMHGPRNYPLKVISIFVSTDRIMGRHFEAGLQNLKSLSEH
jgi:uncharacterized protein YndB with AHSA1/START domain